MNKLRIAMSAILRTLVSLSLLPVPGFANSTSNALLEIGKTVSESTPEADIRAFSSLTQGFTGNVKQEIERLSPNQRKHFLSAVEKLKQRRQKGEKITASDVIAASQGGQESASPVAVGFVVVVLVGVVVVLLSPPPPQRQSQPQIKGPVFQRSSRR